VIGFAERNSNSQWFCQCICNNIIKVDAKSLKNGDTTSCGCFQIEQAKKANITHGHKINGKTSLTYTTWQNMLSRCYNPKYKRFSDYGGRNISVCGRWKSFENFLEDMGEIPKGLTLDRIDNNGNYTKSNCRYATWKKQANNRRNNCLLTFAGKTQNITQWAEEIGIKRDLIYKRINKLNWPIERALNIQ